MWGGDKEALSRNPKMDLAGGCGLWLGEVLRPEEQFETCCSQPAGRQTSTVQWVEKGAPCLIHTACPPTQASSLPAGSCISHSLTSHLSMGECAWRPPAACSAPARMGPRKASSMCPVRKVGWGGYGGWVEWGGPSQRPALTPSAVPRTHLSPTFGFNPCVNMGCGKPAVRPLVDTGAMVFVVFGIIGINRTRQADNHVLGDQVWGPNALAS